MKTTTKYWLIATVLMLVMLSIAVILAKPIFGSQEYEPEVQLERYQSFSGLLTERIESQQAYIDKLETELGNIRSLGYIPWKNETELRRWLETYGVAGEKYEADSHDCDDFAIKLSTIAYRHVRLIWVERKENESGFDHMMNGALVNGRIWLIEPQTNILYYEETLD